MSEQKLYLPKPLFLKKKTIKANEKTVLFFSHVRYWSIKGVQILIIIETIEISIVYKFPP